MQLYDTYANPINQDNMMQSDIIYANPINQGGSSTGYLENGGG